MTAKLELEQNIINITTTILQKFPELLKYIMEMPENRSKEGEINIENLENHYQFLQELVMEYTKSH